MVTCTVKGVMCMCLGIGMRATSTTVTYTVWANIPMQMVGITVVSHCTCIARCIITAYCIGEYLNTQRRLTADGVSSEFPVNDGVRHGFGVRVFTSGNKYEGKWENGMMNSANAIFYKHDGSRYTGGFQNNQR